MSGPDLPTRMIVLSGGENARMESLRGTIYKAFLPIHRHSLVARHLLRAMAFGIRQVDVLVDADDPALLSLATSLRHAPDEDAEGHRHGPAVEIVELPGTMAEKICRWQERTHAATPILAVLGDSLAPVDLRSLWRAAGGRYDSALGLAPVRLPFGTVELRGTSVTGFTEKPTTRFLVNTGYMVLGRDALAMLAEGLPLAEVFGKLAAEGRLGATVCRGPLVTVDSIESLARAHELLASPWWTDTPAAESS